MRQLQPCGTWAAYQRHTRSGEQACDPCIAAMRRYRAGDRTKAPCLASPPQETARDRNRRLVRAYLAGHPCTRCSEPDLDVLDFHHLGDKDAAVSRLVSHGASWEQVEAEIAKCVVLCANDHRRFHAMARVLTYSGA